MTTAVEGREDHDELYRDFPDAEHDWPPSDRMGVTDIRICLTHCPVLFLQERHSSADARKDAMKLLGLRIRTKLLDISPSGTAQR